MAYTISGGYGQLDSMALLRGQSDKAFVVCPSSHPAYNKLIQAFVGDPDGQNRFFTTIQGAVDAAANVIQDQGNFIFVAEGFYDETVTVSADNLTIVGLGGRGATGIEVSAAGAEGMQVTGDDVTLINFGVSGDDTSTYALNVNAAARFRAYGCKFEGCESVGGAQVLINGTADDQTADLMLIDCELAWGSNGIIFDDSGFGYPTQIVVKDCWFHDLTTSHLGVAASGLVKDLVLSGCTHDNAEDGTAPTDYILLSDNGNTGVITRNSFATATNATGVLTIGTGLMWVVNATEAGWSTARPA
jgi:hypothetical protein